MNYVGGGAVSSVCGGTLALAAGMNQPWSNVLLSVSIAGCEVM